jgi:hypothetical protein
VQLVEHCMISYRGPGREFSEVPLAAAA